MHANLLSTGGRKISDLDMNELYKEYQTQIGLFDMYDSGDPDRAVKVQITIGEIARQLEQKYGVDTNLNVIKKENVSTFTDSISKTVDNLLRGKGDKIEIQKQLNQKTNTTRIISMFLILNTETQKQVLKMITKIIKFNEDIVANLEEDNNSTPYKNNSIQKQIDEEYKILNNLGFGEDLVKVLLLILEIIKLKEDFNNNDRLTKDENIQIRKQIGEICKILDNLGFGEDSINEILNFLKNLK